MWLRVDTIEAALLKAGLSQSFETGLAAYVAARDIASEQLRLGLTVVIDAVNGVQEARQMWRDLAREWNVPIRVVEVRCTDLAEHRKRVESRTVKTAPLPAPNWEEVVHREYLPWPEPVLSVNGAAPVDQNVQLILSNLA